MRGKGRRGSPREGLMALAPLAVAGITIEPPVSTPMAAAAKRAMGQRQSPLDPSGTNLGSQAFPAKVPVLLPDQMGLWLGQADWSHQPGDSAWP